MSTKHQAHTQWKTWEEYYTPDTYTVEDRGGVLHTRNIHSGRQRGILHTRHIHSGRQGGVLHTRHIHSGRQRRSTTH